MGGLLAISPEMLLRELEGDAPGQQLADRTYRVMPLLWLEAVQSDKRSLYILGFIPVIRANILLKWL